MEAHITPGMPPIEGGEEKITSWFEFLPTLLFYIPVLFCSIFWALKYRCFTLPLIANPNIYLSGMVGFSKASVLLQAKNIDTQYILPWVTYRFNATPLSEQLAIILKQMEAANLTFPIVGKPDMGCRGVGVTLLNNKHELLESINSYPIGSTLMLQQLSQWKPEAGVFYVRKPNEKKGKITSLSFKYSPHVVGDGQSTLSELLDQDKRASKLRHLYDDRLQQQLQDIIPKDDIVPLVFSASHSKGAIFTDGNKYNTEELTSAIDKMMQDIPEFYYGRLDIKFKHIDDFVKGKHFNIIEINGASSEPLHIWDKLTTFRQAIGSLVFHYKLLYDIGHQNKKNGYSPTSLLELLRAWKTERTLTKHYPATD